MADVPSLLPPGSTWLERALEQVAAARLKPYEVAADAIATRRDPHACPAGYLPWLAWEVSVPYWRTEWPEAFKRRLIAESPAIHRERGHLPGIERGLTAIGLKMEITLWHQMQPEGQPGTFRATLWANDNRTLTPDAIADGIAMVHATKRQSQHPQFLLAAALGGSLGMAGMAAPRQVLTTATPAALRDTATAAIGFAVTGTAAQRFNAMTVSAP